MADTRELVDLFHFIENYGLGMVDGAIDEAAKNTAEGEPPEVAGAYIEGIRDAFSALVKELRSTYLD